MALQDKGAVRLKRIVAFAISTHCAQASPRPCRSSGWAEEQGSGTASTISEGDKHGNGGEETKVTYGKNLTEVSYIKG